MGMSGIHTSGMRTTRGPGVHIFFSKKALGLENKSAPGRTRTLMTQFTSSKLYYCATQLTKNYEKNVLMYDTTLKCLG